MHLHKTNDRQHPLLLLLSTSQTYNNYKIKRPSSSSSSSSSSTLLFSKQNNLIMETAESLDTFISMVARSEEFEEEQYKIGVIQNMEDIGDEEELSGGGGGGGGGQMKKRRLSSQQVRSLEKNFEVENKLEADRKMQLAKELGLQPRQVAVWFQNRRARWKTKQLERDYGLLKHNYDTLKSSFDAIHRENQKLTAELRSVGKKLEEAGKRKGNGCPRGEESNVDSKAVAMKKEEYEEDDGGGGGGGVVKGKVIMNEVIVLNERLEGSETSDSSAILNDNGGGVAGENYSPHPIDSYICTTSSFKYSASYVQPLANHSDIDNRSSSGEGLMEALRAGNNHNITSSASPPYNPQHCFRIDEAEESCNLFNVDDSAAVTFPWWEWK